MLNFDLYAIETDYGHGSDICEYFSSFEDAVKGRFKYANYWRPNGCVDIIKFAKNTKRFIEERWIIDTVGGGKEQKVVEYYNNTTKKCEKNYITGLDEWPIV